MHTTWDRKVPGSNPDEGGIHLMTTAFNCSEPYIITLPSSQYDLNNVERDVKHHHQHHLYFIVSKLQCRGVYHNFMIALVSQVSCCLRVFCFQENVLIFVFSHLLGEMITMSPQYASCNIRKHTLG